MSLEMMKLELGLTVMFHWKAQVTSVGPMGPAKLLRLSIAPLPKRATIEGNWPICQPSGLGVTTVSLTEKVPKLSNWFAETVGPTLIWPKSPPALPPRSKSTYWKNDRETGAVPVLEMRMVSARSAVPDPGEPYPVPDPR